MHSVTDLLALLESEAASLEQRIAAGHALAAAGDPRATALDLVRVPWGVLRRLPGEAVTERGRVPLEVEVSAFSIDRYPVTVAAFGRFLEAGGYRSRELWSERGWAWREQAEATGPRFWGEAAWAAYLVPNHPVVGVSAYEAEAFAAFRGARLPTEAEWERTCRGDDARCYPWGPAWIDDACAMRTVGPRGTVPIGVFRRGESPFGARDLVGCVWQWCADVADDEDPDRSAEDPFTDPEGYGEDAPRVTRGGAWNTLQWSVNCTSRNGYPPTSRFSNLGFRCVAR